MQGASEDVVQAQVAPSPDDPQPLAEEEIEEKEQLLSEGFSNWNRRDFNSFVRACEKVSNNCSQLHLCQHYRSCKRL